jgi:hypothetical protein
MNSFISRNRAIEIAKTYHLENEIKWCIDICGMSPEAALIEWDLL